LRVRRTARRGPQQLPAGEPGSLPARGGLLSPALGQHAILDRLSLATRGAPDVPVNPVTSWAQARKGVEAFGLPWEWTYSWAAAIVAPWAILLVDGVAMRKKDGGRPYPASWFGGEAGPDHFVVSEPLYQGSYDWLMNPLDRVSPGPSTTWTRWPSPLAMPRSCPPCATPARAC
jgi:hypothetical protein